MGPLSFLNGAFLVGLAAAALPVLIHLLSRRRARDLPFSHTEFLDEITRRKVRRLKLRQWLLLLLRTLAVACLALLAWEGFREGIDDMRYATLLMQLADKGEKSRDLKFKIAGRKAKQYLALVDPEEVDLVELRMAMIDKILKLKKLEE